MHAALSPDKHDALVFHYWLDLTVREIALVMQTSESNVKKHLVRGRRHMLKWFTEKAWRAACPTPDQRMVRETDASESGWHLVDYFNEENDSNRIPRSGNWSES